MKLNVLTHSEDWAHTKALLEVQLSKWGHWNGEVLSFHSPNRPGWGCL